MKHILLPILLILIIAGAGALAQKHKSQRRTGNVNWLGSWVQSNDSDSETVTISTKDNSLSAKFHYTRSGDRSGDGEWKNCKLRGNTLTCDWTAKHDDPEKTGTRQGTLKMTLSGDTITGSYLEDVAYWNWKPGYGPHVFDGSMGKGVIHSRNYKRSSKSKSP